MEKVSRDMTLTTVLVQIGALVTTFQFDRDIYTFGWNYDSGIFAVTKGDGYISAWFNVQNVIGVYDEDAPFHVEVNLAS